MSGPPRPGGEGALSASCQEGTDSPEPSAAYETLFVEGPLATRGQRPVRDDIDVAVQQIDTFAVDGQPGTTIDQAPPGARLGDVPRKTQGPHLPGIDVAAIVQAEVPVAVSSLLATRSQSAECDRDDARDPR